jgi:hypothetical protein
MRKVTPTHANCESTTGIGAPSGCATVSHRVDRAAWGVADAHRKDVIPRVLPSLTDNPYADE